MTTFDATRALEWADQAGAAHEKAGGAVAWVPPLIDMLRAAVVEVKRLNVNLSYCIECNQNGVQERDRHLPPTTPTRRAAPTRGRRMDKLIDRAKELASWYPNTEAGQVMDILIARLEAAENACTSAYTLVCETFVGDLDSAHDAVRDLVAWRAMRDVCPQKVRRMDP